MTDNSRNSDPKFDSADLSDLDDDSVIPTYRGGSPTANSTNASDKLYDRTGRAAPQNISPRSPQDNTETSAFERPEVAQSTPLAPVAPTPATGGASTSSPLASDAPTTVTPQPTRQIAREEAYTAPQESYADTDFAPVVAAPVAEQPLEEQPTIIEDARRGTLDFGLLIIRVVIGLYLIVRGVFTFFTLGGSEGLAGLEAEFATYQWPEILAILLPSIELAAGVFLLLGLMTPVAAAVATVATSFTTLHQVNIHEGGWGNLDEPIMLALILTLVVIGLQFTGPGKISLDSGRGWARRPLVSSWIFVVVGIVLAGLLWWFGAGINPLNSSSLM
ncbi:DoxX family membrane protein [Corynebacterium callunae]|uniref:DoxX family protein n=1 Tax=Corynebacterium callunae TaxID=1721 RepID=UPI0039824756